MVLHSLRRRHGLRDTWAGCKAGYNLKVLLLNNLVSHDAFPWLWMWGGKRTFAKTIQKWNVWRRVIFLKKMRTCGSVDGPCIPKDFDAQYLSRKSPTYPPQGMISSRRCF